MENKTSFPDVESIFKEKEKGEKKEDDKNWIFRIS